MDKDATLSKQGSSDASHDNDSQSHDTQYALEESDLFPVSRASSCTVVSEQEKRVLSPAASTDRETPVVKPHPFSFRTTPLSTTGSSSDSYHRHHTNSESDYYERNSDTASYQAVRSKSNSFNYSGEYSYSTSVPNGSSPLFPGTVAKQQQYGQTRIVTTNSSAVAMTTNTLCSCNSRDHPVASKDGASFGYRQFHCKCHYGDPRSCAFDPESESMGLCPINNGFMTFDPNRRYSDDTERSNPFINQGVTIINTPPSPCDDVSLSSNFSQSPHRSNMVPSLSDHSPKDSYHSNNPIRTSCTSIDSGYEKSMSMSSFTSSAKDPISLGDSLPHPPQYGSAGDVSLQTSSASKPESGTVYDPVETKPRARSLCEMERKEAQDTPVSNSLFNKGDSGLYPKLPSLTPQLVIEDLTLTSHQALEANLNTSLASACSSDGSTPVGPLSKSATPSPTSSMGSATNTNAVLQPSLSKAELKRAFFSSKGKKAKGIRTIEDSKMKEKQISLTPDTRPRSDAVCYSHDCNWKTKSCDIDVTPSTATPPTAPPTEVNDNHVTSTPTYFGNRTLGSNPSNLNQHHQLPSHPLNRFNQSWKSSQCSKDVSETQCTPQGCYNFPSNPFTSRFDPRLFSNGSPRQPTFGSPKHSPFDGTPSSKSGTQASISMAVAAAPTLILPSDAQSIISETDSGHCTKSIDDHSQADVDLCSQASELSHISNLDNTSECSEADMDVFAARQGGGGYRFQPSHRNQLHNMYQRDPLAEDSNTLNPEVSLSASYLKLHHDNPSLLHEKLREYEDTVYNRRRPRMLEQFDDFTDVELPTFDEFCLDDSPSELEQDGGSGGLHRHRIGDFGHSLFAG